MSNPEDALRDLAAASSSGNKPIQPPNTEPASKRPESPIANKSQRPQAPPTIERDPAEKSANALASLSGTELSAYDSGQASATRQHQHKLQKPDVGIIGIRLATIPLLITVGLIMLALGLWGIMIKAGNTTLPLADRANAEQLAVLGIAVALPIGILLFASAGFMFYLVNKDKQKLARWETLHGERNHKPTD